MISSIAELLEAIRRQEEDLLARQNIRHPSIIGSMYEGLTKRMLDIGLPKGGDLKVVSGLIKNKHGKHSKQIDCMLVAGDGELIPYTSQYIYDIENVLAVIEVKKNLYSNDLVNAYGNLSSVNELVVSNSIKPEPLRSIYQRTCRSILPDHLDLEKMPFDKSMICFVLIKEILSPVRVIFGYTGFSAESSFRESFVSFLERNVGGTVPTKGFGPSSFPNLIVCGNYSLVKCNGLPYAAPMKDEYWNLYASYSQNPLLILLELIWAKLSGKYQLPAEYFFDDPMDLVLKPFISAKPLESVGGWEYRYSEINEEQLRNYPSNRIWEPPTLNKMQATIVMILGRKGYINTKDKYFRDYVVAGGINVDEFITSLLDTGLIAIDGECLKFWFFGNRCPTPQNMEVVFKSQFEGIRSC